MGNLAIEGVQNSPQAPEIDTRLIDDKNHKTSVRENLASVDNLSPTSGSQDDISSGPSETPTVWMWVLSFVAGISGVSELQR